MNKINKLTIITLCYRCGSRLWIIEFNSLTNISFTEYRPCGCGWSVGHFVTYNTIVTKMFLATEIFLSFLYVLTMEFSF